MLSRFRKSVQTEKPSSTLPLHAEAQNAKVSKMLLRSGIFDHSYYAQVSDQVGGTPHELAGHYVAHGLESGLSPHPLIEVDFLPRPVRESRNAEGVSKLLEYLHTPDARTHAWGPLFDPRVVSDDPVTVLTALGLNSPLPVPEDFDGDVPTLAEARSALIAFTERYREQFAAALPPRRKKWDRAATQQWVSQMSSTASPSGSLVSVIMPVLNRAEMVGQAIESVLAQTHQRLELIVVDDGSTDSTREVVTEYARTDSRVRLLAGPHAGVSATRNTGIRESHGDFVAFLDSDNRWTKRFLELSLAALEKTPNAVASHAALRLHGDDSKVEHRGGDAQLADLQLGNSIDLNVLVVRARALESAGLFDVTLRRWVDYDLILRLARLGRLEYLPFIGCDYDNKTTDGRITQGESLHWQWVVRERNLIDWTALRAAAEDRVADRVSLVLVIAGSTGHTARSIDRVLDTFSADLEIIVVDNGSRAAVGRRLLLRYLSEPRVRYFRLPINNNFALAANYGFAQSTGAHVAFLDSDADPRDGWLSSLAAEQQSSGSTGVQALLVNPDYSVQHAGYAFYEELPLPSSFLADLTIDDAASAHLDGLTAISASASLFDARAFATLSGFDPLYANGLEDVDLCLRAKREIPGAQFACAPGAIVIHERKVSAHRERRYAANRRTYVERWRDSQHIDDRYRYTRLSMTATRLAPTFGPGYPSAVPVLVREAQTITAPSGVKSPSLRWAIKTGVPSTRGGDHWGDIPFASDLATALRALGQQVVIDRHEAWTRPTSHLDDVILTLRGRHAIPPQPGALNILWVISRPDLVTVDEVRSYDEVFAASEKWAMWMSARSGRMIEPLLQATSPERFRPDLPEVERPDDLIFVGGSHGHEFGRAIVGLAIQAEAPIGLWGPGWDKFAPSSAVRDGYLDTSILPNAYRSANIVLNDHYADMAEWGFINNRTFDAIACGTPMISDAIDGLGLFDGAVVTADSVDRMRELVTDRTWMPSTIEMSRISEMVRTRHSFEARADRLMKAVLAAGRR